MVSAVSVLFAVTGCQTLQPAPEPSVACPGMVTIGQAAAALNEQRDRLGPMQAAARCVLQWSDLDDKVRRESFDAQVRFMPPDRLFFRGDKFGEIRFGANEREFWLRIKPELDTYWHGTRDQAQECSHTLLLNPANLAEAIGMLQVDTTWELFHRDGFDWLTQRSEQGRPLKRAYINTCGYRVERIEYFDRRGQITAATELSGYAASADGLTLPTTIRLTTWYQGQEDSAATFELRQVRRFEPTDRQMRNLFERPARDGYGKVLRLDPYCNFAEEN